MGLPLLVKIRKKLLLPNHLEPATFSPFPVGATRRYPKRKDESSPLTRVIRTERKEPMGLLDTPISKDLGVGGFLKGHPRAKNPVTEDSAEPDPPLKGIGLSEYTLGDGGTRLSDASVRGATPVPLTKNGKTK